MQDEFWGKAHETCVKVESNLVPFKPKTDVIINAVARSPEEKELEQWNVGAAIDGRFSYDFIVRGNSEWQPKKIGGKWKLSRSEPMTELPIIYEHAYGGISMGEDDEEQVFAYNPVGKGFYTREALSERKPLPAPQIGDIAEFMQEDIEDGMGVYGFGAINKAWLPRRRLAGNFNDEWLASRHPKMPEDFESAFWNGAPPKMQISPFLLGHEIIKLKGLRHEPGIWELPLAGGGIYAIFHFHDNKDKTDKAKLKLDTVHLDITDKDPGKHRLTQTWRLVFGGWETVSGIELVTYSAQADNKEQVKGENNE